MEVIQNLVARRAVVLALASSLGFSAVAADPTLPTLTNFTQILSLGLTGAREAAHPVRVQGVVVSLPRSNRELMCLTDGTNGLGVGLRTIAGLTLIQPKIGDRVEVEGETAAGASHPFAAHATARILGRGRFPEPVAARARQIAAGGFHGGMVKLRAVVLDASRLRGLVDLFLNADGHTFYATIHEPADHLPVEWLNAVIEVQGMPWIQFDSAGKPTWFKMFVSSNNWVRVISPGSADVFAARRMTLKNAGELPLSDERFVTAGTVTYVWPNNFIVVEDDAGAAGIAYGLSPIQRVSREVEYADRPPRPKLRPGDQVDLVVSKSVRRSYVPRFENYECRVTGSKPLPPPPLVTEAEVLSSRYDARRVRMIGRVVDADTYEQSGSKVSRLWVKFGEQTCYAMHAGTNYVTFPAVTGDRVDLTGLCLVSPGVERPVRAFNLYLSSPGDARRLPDPPVWLSGPVLRAGGVAGGVLALAFGWVWMLRRQVRRQTTALRQSNEQLAAEARERATSETRLRESEARFAKTFQASPTSIVLTRLADSTIVAANEAFLKTTGFTEEEVIGRPIPSLNIYAEPAQRDEYLRAVRERGSVRDREQRLRTKTGDVRTMLIAGELIELGGQPHLLTAGLDITERKQVEMEMARALARERELSELKSNFVSMVSHEFRTPLGVIQSASDVLARYLDRLTPEKRQQHLDMIFRSTRNLAQLVDGVLLLGRVEDGRLQFKPVTVNLATFCPQLVDEVLAATTRLSPIDFQVGPGLTEAASDPDLLRHILTNLLTNAVKYSSAGAAVRFSVERQGDDAVVIVQDRGIGIADEDQRALFQAFSRGRNVGDRPGTGLGLVIVQRCVQLHGGQLELRSKLGEGTTVTVRLPVFAPALLARSFP